MSRSRVPDEAQVESALALAIEPLARRRTTLSAARVRAAIRWERHREPGRAWHGIALLGRMSETSLAVAVTVLVLVGSVPAAAPEAVVVDDARPEVTMRVNGAPEDPGVLWSLRTAFDLYERPVRLSAPVHDLLDPSVGAVAERLGEDTESPGDRLPGGPH